MHLGPFFLIGLQTIRADDPDATKLHPTIFVPGILGARMEAKLNRTWVPHWICSKKSDWFNIWMNYEIMVPLSGTCWVENLWLEYNNMTKTTNNPEGVQIRPECWGDTDCIEWLDPHHLIGPGRYFHDIIQAFVRNGYEVNNTLKAATYDWRKSPSSWETDYFPALKQMTEDLFAKFNKKVVFVAHSMGNPALSKFFTLQSAAWKKQHVKVWAAIAPVFLGAPKSLKSLINGENDGIPRILVGMIQMRNLLRTFPSNYFLVPNEFQNAWPKEHEIIVYTDERNYTASVSDMKEMFERMDYSNSAEQYEKFGQERSISDPGVPTHIFYGVNLDTTCAMDYTNKRFPDYSPKELQCSGDGTVPEFSSSYPFYHWKAVKKTEVNKAEHNELLRDEEVINTILSYSIDDFSPPSSSNKLRFKPDLSFGKGHFKKPYWRLPID